MSSGDLFLIVLSFLPGVAYLLLVARYDRQQREPRRYLFGVYALGMFSVVPAAFLELAAGEVFFGSLGDVDPAKMVLAAFLVIGPAEEVCKYLAVRSIYESPYFEDPLDGVVYASAAAMGFASLENAFYVAEFGWQVFWLRAVLAIPGHLVFAAFWGYQLGRRKFGLGGNVLKGLALAAFAHGLYDALLMANVTWLAYLVVPLMAGMIYAFRRQVRELWSMARAWDLGIQVNARLFKCGCGARFGVIEPACPSCGSGSPTLACARCGSPTSWRQDTCAHCNTPFEDSPIHCARCNDPYPPHLSACPFCGFASPS